MSTFLAASSPLASLISATLEKDGTMQSVRAALKAQVFKQLSQVSMGKENSSSLSNLNKLNQVKSDERYVKTLSLVLDVLSSMGLHQTASLLKTEVGSPEVWSVSRSSLAMELGISADSDQLPLMFQVLDALKTNESFPGSSWKESATSRVQSAVESCPSNAQPASPSCLSLSPSEPKSASPRTQDKRNIDISKNSPSETEVKNLSPKSLPKAPSVAASLSPAKSVESAISESIEESIDSVKSSPITSPAKLSKSSSPTSASLPTSLAVSPGRMPLMPSSSPSKSPETTFPSPRNDVLLSSKIDDQCSPQGHNDGDAYMNYQNVLDSEEFKSATANRLHNDAVEVDNNVDSTRIESSKVQASVKTIFPPMEKKVEENKSISLGSEDEVYHEAVSRSLEEVPEEEDSPEESFATAGSYEEAEAEDSMEGTHTMPLSNLKGRDNINVSKVKKVVVEESTVGREEERNNGLGRASVTRLGGGGTSRLSRSNAGWNMISSDSPIRDDGPENFDLSASPTSSPSEKSNPEPGSKRSSPRPKNINTDIDETNLSDSFELEDLGNSDGSNSTDGMMFPFVFVPILYL